MFTDANKHAAGSMKKSRARSSYNPIDDILKLCATRSICAAHKLNETSDLQEFLFFVRLLLFSSLERRENRFGQPTQTP
jgi:hypothetical protein